ncbi:Pentatricopeptide repeat-containing protein -mitochondrial [Striga hermonthica]|uniref:Pentatricopeptide repeat-containing protein -mitochondrial n=1 Tax=Striga hermonthica TaxID=68872 RepID=A0A9N7RM98_STRHE|nr:Pentatricopeptide repeat-containing protein -mitochondrial [Striga hermonthica]
MALRGKLRQLLLQRRRFFSTSPHPAPVSRTLPANEEQTRTTLALVLSEPDPARIPHIFRSTSLTPESHFHRHVYTKAISKLMDSNDHDSIRTLIRDSIERLSTRKSEHLFSQFIVLYGRGGLVGDAVDLFDRMPAMGVNRNVKTLNSLLYSCLLAGDYSEMARIFRDFPQKYGLKPELDTYNTVLKGFCDGGCSSEAHAILAEMEGKNVKPNLTTFATIIAGFYMEEKNDEVGKILNLMKKHGVKPGISIYNVRIKSLCKLGRSEEARALLGGIVSKGIKPTRATYGSLIYGFCREGKLEVAKGLFGEMVGKGLEPEPVCYFTLVFFMCKGGDFEAALDVCREVMGKGWVPNMTTMKLLVDGLVGIGKVDEAREIIGHVKEKFQRNSDKWSEVEDGLPKL